MVHKISSGLSIRHLRPIFLVYAIFLSLLVCDRAQAKTQTDGDFDIELDDIESHLEKDSERRKEKSGDKKEGKKKKGKNKLSDLSDLANLAPFSDIAVIQKRFLYKTQRFEGFLGGAGLMNEAFFNNVGAVGKMGYYFSEKWGVEASYFALFTSKRQVTRSLADRQVITESLVTPKGFYGLDIKWVPIYGKMAFFDERIVPFDLYFSLGAGLTQTNQEGSSASASTIKIGTGQMFAIRKWLVFRWDFSWHFFKPEVTEEGATNSGGSINNLFLIAGFSFLFPETKYR